MDTSFSFSDNTVGYFIDGVVDEKSIDELHDQIADKIDKYGTINLYLEDMGIETFTLPAFIDQVLFKIKNANQLNKVAIVTDKKWLKACGTLHNLFVSTSTKNFDTEQRMEAMSWIAER